MAKKTLFIFFILLSTALKAQTLREVYDEIQCNHIKYVDIVLRQAMLESGNMKTKFFYRTNNLFGFKTHKGYMKYETWQESVLYYFNWQQRHYTDTTKSYTSFLRTRKYARNMSSYFKKLNTLKVPDFANDSTLVFYKNPELAIAAMSEPKKNTHKKAVKDKLAKLKRKKKKH